MTDGEETEVEEQPSGREVGEALALLVHDLRNPAATVNANIAFMKGSDLSQVAEDQDFIEALEDLEIASRDLMDGLRHFGWMARWMLGQSIGDFPNADLAKSLAMAQPEIVRLVTLEVEGEVGASRPGMNAQGGGALPKLVRIFAENAHRHARGGVVRWRLRNEGEWVVFEHEDTGATIAPELRTRAFALAGQSELKGRRDGRYGRCLSLFSAGLIARAIGAEIEAAGEDGAAIFRVRFRTLG